MRERSSLAVISMVVCVLDDASILMSCDGDATTGKWN